MSHVTPQPRAPARAAFVAVALAWSGVGAGCLVAGCQVPNPAYDVTRADAASLLPIDGWPVDASQDGGVDASTADLGTPPDARAEVGDASAQEDAFAQQADGAPAPDAEVAPDAAPEDAHASIDAAPPPDTRLPDPTPQQLLEGLVAYWPLDDGAGNAARDRAGNNHGRLEHPEPARAWRPGFLGGAVAFDANDGWAIEVAPTSAINRITSQLTVAAWVRPAAFDDDELLSVISRQLGDGNSDQYDLALLRGRLLCYMFDEQRQAHNFAGSTRTVPTGTWTHVAATYDGTTLRLYVNGALDGSATFRARLISDGKPVFIGTNINMGTYDRRETFHGLIDEVVLYSRALAPGEIVALYQLRESLR